MVSRQKLLVFSGFALLLALQLLQFAPCHAQTPNDPSPKVDKDALRLDAAEEAAMLRRSREAWRADAWSRASATCTGRAKYDGDRIVLAENYGAQAFEDSIEAYDDKGLYWVDPKIHLLVRCDELLRATIVELLGNEWREYLLVSWAGQYQPVRLFGLPHSTLGGDAAAAVAHDQGALMSFDRGIEIAIRDSYGIWRKAWHYVPIDVWECEFLTWEGPNRFRVLMHDQAPNSDDRKRWESVIEFTPTTLTRTDGPKTPTKPTP